MPARSLHEACAMLGLGEDQAKVYTELVHAGRATAGDMARLVGMSRAMAYRLLRELASMGLVHEVPDRPLRFIAVDPKAALQMAATMASARAKRFEEVALTLPERKAGATATWTRPEDVTLLSGRRAVQQEMRRMLDKTRNVFAICAPGLVAIRLVGNTDLLWAMRRAASQGVNVLVLLPQGSDPGAVLRIRQEIGEERVLVMPGQAAPFIKYVVNDEAMLAVMVQPDDADPQRGHDLGIRVASRNMVNNTLRNMQRMGSTSRIAPIYPDLELAAT